MSVCITTHTVHSASSPARAEDVFMHVSLSYMIRTVHSAASPVRAEDVCMHVSLSYMIRTAPLIGP